MSSLEQLYQQVILDHARERHGHGLREAAAPSRSADSHQYNPLCGDEVTMRVAVDGAGADGAGVGVDGARVAGDGVSGGRVAGDGVSGDGVSGDAVAGGAVAGGGDQAGLPVVRDVSWTGDGCSISQASISVLYDLVVGRPVAEAEHVAGEFRAMVRSRGQIEPDEEVLGDGVAFAGVGRHANRVKCAMLGWTAFEDALHRLGVSTTAGEENR